MSDRSPAHISKYAAHRAGDFAKFAEWRTRERASRNIPGCRWLSVNRLCQFFVVAGMTLLDARCAPSDSSCSWTTAYNQQILPSTPGETRTGRTILERYFAGAYQMGDV